MSSLSIIRPATSTAVRNLANCHRIAGRGLLAEQKQSRTTSRKRSSSSVSANELSHFSGLANSWWDPMGPSRVLHLMNPTRHDFIASCLTESEPKHSSLGDGLKYLDVGCGGGIFAESLARTLRSDKWKPASGLHPRTKAGSILAIDPSTSLIKIARDHASMDPAVYEHLQSGAFRYENTTIENLALPSATTPSATNTSSKSPSRDNQQFDVITLFEVIEHVDPHTASSFLTHCLRVLKPGGWLIGSTIARTVTSFLVNKLVAEAPWPIGVVPWGTHEWNKFVNSDELRGWVEEGLMRATDGAAYRAGSEALQGMKWKVAGVAYVPGLGWKMVNGGEDWGNYFWAVQKGV